MFGSKGFSLVELIAVLLIISIVAGAVMLRVQGPLHSTQMRDVIDQVRNFDLPTRSYALEQDRPVHLVVDLAAGELSRTDTQGTQLLGEPLKLPLGCRIARLLVRGEDVSTGSIAIGFSRLGLSPSYAVLLEGPGNRRQWILVAGLSGEIVEIDDEQEVQNILDAAGQGVDAG